MPDDTLWDFAVRTYARDGVAELCLRLQDEHGFDVDVLLGALWSATRGLHWDFRVLCFVLKAAAPAHARVQSIRALRRAVGEECQRDAVWQPTYEHLKAAELAAERAELGRIESVLADRSSSTTDVPSTDLAVANARAYANHLGTDCASELGRLVRLAMLTEDTGSSPR